MKVLIVTGQMAEEEIKRQVEGSTFDVEVEVLALPISVAALLTPCMIAAELKNRRVKDFQLILIPGLVRGDASLVEKKIGVPTFKGPKYSADLPLVLDSLDHLELSSERAVDESLWAHRNRRALKEMEIGLEKGEALLSLPGNTVVGGLGVGRGFPMRIMAEILGAPLLSDREILDKGEYYKDSGADILCIGSIKGEPLPRGVSRAVKIVKGSLNLPVAIDTFEVEEAEAGVGAGADMLLSADSGNLEEVAEFASDIPVVVTSTSGGGANIPREASERVECLEENVRRAISLGLEKVIGDPVLGPLKAPGIMESLVAYHSFSQRNPGITLLLASENVTELTDVDSVGLNALLAGMASELNVSVILTTEGSVKTDGSVREAAIASKMMFLADKRGSVPKDLGLDLLILKDKRRRGVSYEDEGEKSNLILEATELDCGEGDAKGSFRILLNRRGREMVAIHYPEEGERTTIRGRRAEAICSTILNMKLVSNKGHASYLGRELQKAETALRIGKDYVQDEPLFDSRRMERFV